MISNLGQGKSFYTTVSASFIRFGARNYRSANL